ncbi:MAG: hypothetical protein ACLGHL_04705 [Actinomycetota bacterium]
MDETTVREHAERHGAAVVAGDLRTAGADLTPEAQAQAPGVMKNLPKDLRAANVFRIALVDDAYEAYISYEGADSETIVISTWAERDGTPKITNLSLG